MRTNRKLISTTWVSVTGIFLTVFSFAAFSAYLVNSFTLFQSIISGSILVTLYGVIFWAGFILSLILLDILLPKILPEIDMRVLLLIEWAIISTPFIYWSIKYRQWIFLLAVGAFFITQYLRSILVQRRELA